MHASSSKQISLPHTLSVNRSIIQIKNQSPISNNLTKMSSPFTTLPPDASLSPKPFKAYVPDCQLSDFHQLLKLSKVGPQTYENSTADVKDFTSFGITRSWLVETKEYWETKYDWRKTEERINGFPNYTVPIEDEENGFTFDIHFIALFSKKSDAVPVLLLHGWPGSPLEFLGALGVLMEKFKEDELPYHVVVPSLPGYAYSSGPPLDKDFKMEGTARVVDNLMKGLGFGKGYVSQGGDIGSFVSRILAVTAESCLAVHCEWIPVFFSLLWIGWLVGRPVLTRNLSELVCWCAG
jgi:microsomal epoxide hydrolase